VLITAKAGTRELLINYFKKHYGSEWTAAGNLKWLLLPIVTVGENGLELNRPCHHYQIIQDQTLTPMNKPTTHKQMFSEESDNDEF